MERQVKPGWRKFRKILLIAFAAGLLAAVSLLIYIQTDSFRNMVDRRLVSALEHMTGGRVELGRFNVVPLRFRVEAHDLTIHGSEAPGELPYAHVDNLIANIKIISIFEREYGFSSLTLDRPIFHIIVYPDGTTNQPSPKIKGISEKTPVEELFSFSIGQLEVRRGELVWNNQSIELDFAAHDVSAGLDYSLVHDRYDSHLRIGKLDSKLRDFRPFSSILDVEFALAKTNIEVKSLEWSSARSRLEASGRISDFRNPNFSGTYNLRLDLADLASVLRIRELIGGTLEAGGTGSYSARDFASAGKMLIKDLTWQDSSTKLRNVKVSGKYSLTPTTVKLSEFEAHLLGGSATLNMDISHWLRSPQPAGGKRVAPEERGTLSLRFKDLSASEAVQAFSNRRLRLERLPVSGSAEGYLEAKWKGDRRKAEAAFTVNVVPLAHTPAGQIPLSARLVGVFRPASEELELAELNVATRATVIRATGRLSSRASLHLTASTTDLAEWQPVLAAFGGPQIPIQLNGRASFNGSATGKLSDPTFSGRVEMEDFDLRLRASSELVERRVHWDSLVADVVMSRRKISARNAHLARGDASVDGEASAFLEDGQLTPHSPFAMRVRLRNGDLSELESLAGYTYPATGRVNLTLNLSGTKLDPHGDGHVEVDHGSFGGEAVPRFASDLRFTDGEIQLNNILLAFRDSVVTGGGAYSPTARAFRFNIQGKDFNLSRFAELQKARISVAGRMDFSARGTGTLDAPQINASFNLRDLSFDNERAGDFNLEAETQGVDLRLKGRSNFTKAELSIDGVVHLRQDWPAELTLRFDHLDVDSLLRAYLGNRVTGHALMAGGLELRGPLRQARDLSVNGDLSHLSLNLENVALENQGPVRFTIARQAINLDQLRLRGEGTDIAARGRVQLSGDRELDLTADGRLNLKLIENFSSDLTSTGELTVAVKVGGTYSHPSLLGNAEVRNASISSNNLPNGLSEMKGTLVFNQNRLEIQSLTARIGGGTVNFSGSMTYSPRVEFNVMAQGQGVRLRPAGISATANAELQLVGTEKEATLSGELTVVKLNLSPGFDFARYLEASKQTTTLPQANTILNNVRLDVHVVTTPELEMQSSLAKLSGDADLHLRGTLVRPVVLGRVDIMEGNIYFSGTKYRLERGEITFLGPTGIKPTLDLEASTHVRDYDITLGVNGTPEKLNFAYRSEPPLPNADIVALLALGRTQSESTSLAGSSQSGFSQEASNLILSQALNATLSNRAQRLFGISRIKVDPQGLNTETTPTRTAPAVTIEQQVSNNFTLTYTTEVSQTTQQVIQAEYNVTHAISILAVRDQNGVVSFDVRLRQRRK